MTSFVICSIDAEKFRKVSANIAERMSGEEHEVIGIHDARGLCEGFNRGMQKARGQTLVFCHDDIEIISPDFAVRLRGHMQQFDVAGVVGGRKVIGGSWSYAGPPHLYGQLARTDPKHNFVAEIFSVPKRSIGKIRVLDGLFMAVRRGVVDRIRFDEQTFGGWHVYDADFTYSAYLAGFSLGVMADVYLIHESMGTADQSWVKYLEAFARKFNMPLQPLPAFVPQQVVAATRQRLLEIMTPDHWDE